MLIDSRLSSEKYEVLYYNIKSIRANKFLLLLAKLSQKRGLEQVQLTMLFLR